MTRGKKKQPAVDQKQMAKMMAMMSKVMTQTLPRVGIHGDLNFMKEGQKEELIKIIKTEHEECWQNYCGESFQAIRNIIEKLSQIGHYLHQLYETRPSDENQRKEHYRTKGKGVTGRNSAARIVKELMEERQNYIRFSERVHNKNGEVRSRAFLERLFPAFHVPKFAEGDGEFSLRHMFRWLKNTKRRAFNQLDTHITLNTLPESKLDKDAHGRVKRTPEMIEFRMHFRAAQKAKHELHMLLNEGKPKKERKHKKEPKKHEPPKARRRPNPAPPPKRHAQAGAPLKLTPFPDF